MGPAARLGRLRLQRRRRHRLHARLQDERRLSVVRRRAGQPLAQQPILPALFHRHPRATAPPHIQQPLARRHRRPRRWRPARVSGLDHHFHAQRLRRRGAEPVDGLQGK